MLTIDFLHDIKVEYSYDKKEMIKALYHIKKVFDENNIDFWLDAGTLLGAIRDNKIIEWDNDIDICIWNTDIDKISKLRNEINKTEFELYIIPIHFFPYSFGHYGLRLKKNRKHVLCIFSCFVSNYDVVWMRTLPFIGNMIRYFKNKNNICSILWKIIIRFKLYKVEKIRYSTTFLKGFKSIVFYDKTFLVPYNSECCLCSIYGDWKTPKHKGDKINE